MTLQTGESVLAFKTRCGEQLKKTVAEGFFATGRFHVTPDGLENTYTWGIFFPDELPSDTCVIASYVEGDARLAVHPYSKDEFEAAPRNPDIAATRPAKALRDYSQTHWLHLQKVLKPPRYWQRWNLHYTKRVLSTAPGSQMAGALLMCWPQRVQQALRLRFHL